MVTQPCRADPVSLGSAISEGESVLAIMSRHQAGVGGKGCREDGGQELCLVHSTGGHGVQAHGGGSRLGLFHSRNVDIRARGQVGEPEQKHTPPTLFHQAGVLSLPQVVAETLSNKHNSRDIIKTELCFCLPVSCKHLFCGGYLPHSPSGNCGRQAGTFSAHV